MIFENSSREGIFGPNMSDSPNWSLTANSRSLQAAALKWIVGGELAGGEVVSWWRVGWWRDSLVAR